jgi:hypothetical protein
MKSPPRRTVQDIRTMSERISETDNPQRKYLALAMLELEKARRNKEKQSARQRVDNIDRRIAEIEQEQTGLLAVARTELMETALADGPAEADGPGASGAGFRLAY